MVQPALVLCIVVHRLLACTPTVDIFTNFFHTGHVRTKNVHLNFEFPFVANTNIYSFRNLMIKGVIVKHSGSNNNFRLELGLGNP